MRALASLFACLAFAASAAVNVPGFATSGTGSASDPWLGWDSAITWTQETQYNFPSGVYSYAASPNFLQTGIALVGEAGTVLRFTGSGNAVVFDNPGGFTPATRNWTMNVRFENFIIEGTASATNGLFVRGARNGIFRHVAVRNVSGAGFWCEACVTNLLENFRVSLYETASQAWTVRPAYGVVLAGRGNDWTTTTTITNPVIEGTGQIGIWIKPQVYGNTIINGTSESNLGRGALVEGHLNTFINTDFEGNTGNDLEVCGHRNRFVNILSDDRVKVNCGQGNTFEGGNFINIDIAQSVDFTRVDGVYTNTGAINDLNANTFKARNQSVADGLDKRSFDGSMQETMAQLTPAAGAVTVNAKAGSLYWMAIYSDVAATITGAVNGQKLTLRVQQDSIGGHLLSSPQFESPPSLNTLPGAYTYVSCRWNSQTNHCQLVP